MRTCTYACVGVYIHPHVCKRGTEGGREIGKSVCALSSLPYHPDQSRRQSGAGVPVSEYCLCCRGGCWGHRLQPQGEDELGEVQGGVGD